MRAFIDSQRAWLTAERLPAYAPELNPVEFLCVACQPQGWGAGQPVQSSLIEVADMLMVLVVQTAPFEALLIPFFIMLRQLDLVWLSTFQTAFGTDWGGTMAASSLFTLPVVVFFLIIQRRLVSGLTAGAVKG